MIPVSLSARSASWWIAALIVVVGFALRVHRLDAVRHEFDRGSPHGLGIAIVESVEDGRWSDLPIVSLSTSVGLPNPPVASYLWALVALIDRSPFTATALSAMLNTLVVAMTYNLAARWFGRRTGWAAALLAASSPWSIYTARGTWVQGWLELAAVGAAWLILPALEQVNRKRLIGGALLTALFSQTYLLAFGVSAQVFVAMAMAGRSLRRLGGAVAAALAVLAGGIGLFGLVIVSGNWTAHPSGSGFDKFPVIGPSLPNPFGIRIDYTAAVRTAAMTSGRGYNFPSTDTTLDPMLGDSDTRGTAWPMQARSALVELLLAVGFAMALRRARRSMGHRWPATWIAFPVASAMIIGVLRPKVDFLDFYFLMTQPAGYILAALPLGALMSASNKRALTVLAGVALTTCAVASAVAVVRDAERALAQPLIRDMRFGTPTVDRLPTLPLHWQPLVRDIWRRHCRTLNDAAPQNWLISMNESGRLARAGRWAMRGDSYQWMISPQGGDCVTLSDTHPVHADAYPIQLNASAAITVYRARSVQSNTERMNTLPGWQPLYGQVYGLSAPALPLHTNIGWRLINVELPSHLQAGTTVDVIYTWHIDELPDEPHDAWTFDCFAQLIDQAGDELAVARAAGLPGAVWQVGYSVIGVMRLTVPAQLAAGDYAIRVSLYDPTQEKNAVFVDLAYPDRAILFVEHHFTYPDQASHP